MGNVDEPRTGPALLAAVRGRMAKNYSASKSRAKGFVAAKRDVGLLVTEVVRLHEMLHHEMAKPKLEPPIVSASGYVVLGRK